MATSIVSQIAEDFAEQKVMLSNLDGVDPDILKNLWKANALEVLAFALPRLAIEPDVQTREMDPQEVAAALAE